MTKAPSQIEQMLIDLGEPRDRFEQTLIAKIRVFADTERRLDDSSAWVRAYTTYMDVLVYRDCGVIRIVNLAREALKRGFVDQELREAIEEYDMPRDRR